jgi:uncharacterized protein YjbI with pentapeptide repeats
MDFLGYSAAIVTTILIGGGFVAILFYMVLPLFMPKGKGESTFVNRHRTNFLYKIWVKFNVNHHHANAIRAPKHSFDHRVLIAMDFHESELQNANFEGSNLMHVNFQNTNLWHACMKDCDLRGANLMKADLQEADLRNANLETAKLDGARLRGAKFNGQTRLPFPEDQAKGRGMIFVAS